MTCDCPRDLTFPWKPFFFTFMLFKISLNIKGHIYIIYYITALQKRSKISFISVSVLFSSCLFVCSLFVCFLSGKAYLHGNRCEYKK